MTGAGHVHDRRQRHGGGDAAVSSARTAAPTYLIVSSPPARVSGRFASLVEYGNFTGTMSLDYSNPATFILDVGAGYNLLSAPSGANHNEQNVAQRHQQFLSLWRHPAGQFPDAQRPFRPSLLNALTQFDGEDATGAQKSAFQLMQDFLDMLLDPSLDGQGGGGGGQATPLRAGPGCEPAAGYRAGLCARAASEAAGG